MNRLTVSLLLVIPSFAALAQESRALTVFQRIDRDVRYADVPPGVDPKLLSLDIYAPKGMTNLPVMVYIHGGGWQGGDKSEVGLKADYFTGRGFVFVSLNYRFVPDVDILMQLQDSANAIGWVYRTIDQHGGDPARLHLIGHSVGAHHVAIIATNERFLSNVGVPFTALRSVVKLDTQALDLPRVMRESSIPLYERAFGSDPETWRAASPVHHVAPDKNIPPFLLAVADGRGPKLAQADAFRKALEAACVRCAILDAPQHDHGSLNRSLGDPSDRITKTMEAFHDSLRGTRTDTSPAGIAVEPVP